MDFRLKLRFVLWFLKIFMGKQIFIQDEKSLLFGSFFDYNYGNIGIFKISIFWNFREING